MTDSLHRSLHRSVDRLATPVGPPVGQEVLRTDGRDGRTNEESFSPTRDNPSSSVTRTRTYGFSSLADSIEEILPGMPDVPPVFEVPKGSAGQRLTERQANDVRQGRHPLTGGKFHEQADMGAKVGDSKNLPFRCGSCIHRLLLRHHDGTYPKCERSEMTHGTATDVRAWWPACPQWEDSL